MVESSLAGYELYFIHTEYSVKISQKGKSAS